MCMGGSRAGHVQSGGCGKGQCERPLSTGCLFSECVYLHVLICQGVETLKSYATPIGALSLHLCVCGCVGKGQMANPKCDTSLNYYYRYYCISC